MRQAALVLQIVVGPAKKIRNRVPREERRRRAFRRQVPEDHLGAVLAEFRHMRLAGPSPSLPSVGHRGGLGSHVVLLAGLCRQCTSRRYAPFVTRSMFLSNPIA